MTFHDEIVKLQERVAALEAKVFGTDAPVDVTPAVITQEYLDSLSIDQIGDLYKAGKINEGALGLAVTRKVFPSGVPEELQSEFGDEPEPAAEHDGPTIDGQIADSPEPLSQKSIDQQNAHDRETGNVNEAGETPYEAVESEAAQKDAPAAGVTDGVEDAGLES